MPRIDSKSEKDIWYAEVSSDGSLHIWGIMARWQKEPTSFDRSFFVGDLAEFDSYNLSYFGKIVKFSEKTVTIETHGLKRGNARLNMYQFIWRNWDFDANKAREHNFNWMD